MSDDVREYNATRRLNQTPEEAKLSGAMTKSREEHLKSMIEDAARRLDTKYRKGQAEHGGNLWDVPTIQLVENAIEEAIDQLTYLLTIREKLVGR